MLWKTRNHTLKHVRPNQESLGFWELEFMLFLSFKKIFAFNKLMCKSSFNDAQIQSHTHVVMNLILLQSILVCFLPLRAFIFLRMLVTQLSVLRIMQ